MSSAFFFLQNILILGIEGSLLGALLLPSGSWLLPVALSLPLAAFVNVLLVLMFTIAGVPLSAVTMLGGHLVLTAGLIILMTRKPSLLMDQLRETYEKPKGVALGITVIAALLITMNAVYSFAHAVMLPSNQYDSATNWTMRSEISFVDGRIAFDPDESRGMAKPQYPFLFHALQIMGNTSLPDWSDTAANAVLYLLSIGTFATLFMAIRKLRGTPHATVTIAAILGIPLLGLHMAQGYGDLNLVQYFLLSIAMLALWHEEENDRRRTRFLVLSGVFIAASVWTKSEGLIFGLLPWTLVTALSALLTLRKIATLFPAWIPAYALSIPWPVFATLKGLPLTPHSSDTLFAFHTEGLSEAIIGLFSRGSFGIHWYVLLFLIPVIFTGMRRKDPRMEPRQLPLLAFGIIVFVEFLFIYLCTPNVRFLLNAESYYRQMMIPAAMLILGCSLGLRRFQKS